MTRLALLVVVLAVFVTGCAPGVGTPNVTVRLATEPRSSSLIKLELCIIFVISFCCTKICDYVRAPEGG